MARNCQGLQLVRCCWWNIRCWLLLPFSTTTRGMKYCCCAWGPLDLSIPTRCCSSILCLSNHWNSARSGKECWGETSKSVVFSKSKTWEGPPSKTLLSTNPTSWRAGLWSKARHSFSGGSLSGQMLSWLSPHLQDGVLPDSDPHTGAAPQRKSRRVYGYEHALMALHTNLAEC